MSAAIPATWQDIRGSQRRIFATATLTTMKHDDLPDHEIIADKLVPPIGSFGYAAKVIVPHGKQVLPEAYGSTAGEAEKKAGARVREWVRGSS